MKQLAKSMVLASVLTAAGSASADWFDCFCPFVGLDYYQVWMKPKNSWVSIFPKTYPGATFYLGGRFCENLGFEVGYDTSTRKGMSYVLPRGTRFFNGTTVSNLTAQTKLRRSGAHFDLIGYWPLVECFELFGTIGYGWVQGSITTTINNINVDPVASAIISTTLKGRSVLRLGLGVNYMLTDMIGVRLKGGYETTSSIRAKGNNIFTTYGFSTKPFKGTATLAAGGFIRF